MSYRIGVDIGGTFADFCALDEATDALHDAEGPLDAAGARRAR